MKKFMNPIFKNISEYFNNPPRGLNLSDSLKIQSPTLSTLPSIYTNDYYSPFTLIFVHQLSNLKFLKTNRFILARDGLLDLICFFLKYPNPPSDTKSTFLFPNIFSSFIPKPWHQHSLGYHYFYRQNPLHLKSNKIITAAHLNIDSINLNYVQQLKSQSQYRQNLFFIHDHSPTYSQSIIGYENECQKLKKNFYKALPNHSQFIDHQQIVSIDIDSTWTYLNLDSAFLIYDRWIEHYFSSLGVTICHSPIKVKNDFVQFSLNTFEDIVIQVWDEKENLFADIYFDFKQSNITIDSFRQTFRNELKNKFMKTQIVH